MNVCNFAVIIILLQPKPNSRSSLPVSSLLHLNWIRYHMIYTNSSQITNIIYSNLSMSYYTSGNSQLKQNRLQQTIRLVVRKTPFLPMEEKWQNSLIFLVMLLRPRWMAFHLQQWQKKSSLAFYGINQDVISDPEDDQVNVNLWKNNFQRMIMNL